MFTDAMVARLHNAAHALYAAGKWTIWGKPPAAQAALWEELRDSLRIPAGQSVEEPLPAGISEMEEAASLVYGDRQGDYGTPRENWGGIAKVWSGLLAKKLKADLTAEEAALMMSAMKLQRQFMKPKRDNKVDAHGYIIVAARAVEEP